MFIVLIPFSLESGVDYSVDRHELGTHLIIQGVMHFAIFQCNKLLLFMILKRHEIIRMRNERKNNILVFIV